MVDTVQIHHILPREIYEVFAERIFDWTNGAFDLHAGYNLIPLPTSASAAAAMDSALHAGYHADLSAAYGRLLNDISKLPISDAQKGAAFNGLHSFFRGALDYSGAQTNGILTILSSADSKLAGASLDSIFGVDAGGNYFLSLDVIAQTDAYIDGVYGTATNQSFNAVNALTYSFGEGMTYGVAPNGFDPAEVAFSQKVKNYLGLEIDPVDGTFTTRNPYLGTAIAAPALDANISGLTNDLNSTTDVPSATIINDILKKAVSQLTDSFDRLDVMNTHLTASGALAIDTSGLRLNIGEMFSGLDGYIESMRNSASLAEFKAFGAKLSGIMDKANSAIENFMRESPNAFKYIAYAGAAMDVAGLAVAFGVAYKQFEAGDVDAAAETMAGASASVLLSYGASALALAVTGAIGAGAAPALLAALAAGVAMNVFWGQFVQENPGWLEAVINLEFSIEEPRDPLVIDLDGDGIELVSLDDSSAYFDLDGDGYAELTGWVSSDDGLLAIDRDGNGVIDDISELFGSSDQTGYEELQAFDTNGDGVVNNLDANFGDLLLWQDFDGDGISQEYELSTLDEAGIVELSLSTTDVDLTVEGNAVIETADVTFSDGSTTQSWEVLFNMSQVQSNVNLPESFTYDEGVFTLPYLRGFGEVSDLWVNMTETPELQTEARTLIADARNGDFEEFTDGFDSFLSTWAGVDDLVWRQDAVNLVTHIVFETTRIEEIIEEVESADQSAEAGDGNGSGAITITEPSYDGPMPARIGFIFDAGNVGDVDTDIGDTGSSGGEMAQPLTQEEINAFLDSLDGTAPYYMIDGIPESAGGTQGNVGSAGGEYPASFWGFPITTADVGETSVSVGSAPPDPQVYTMQLNTVGVDLDDDMAPDMDVGSFAFLQLISGQDYRQQGNYIAPENVVVATPTAAELPAIIEAYETVRDYMAVRFMTQSVQTILAEEGADADLGALAPMQHLFYNPFTDDIAGQSNDFVVDFITMYRDDGYGTDAEALEVLAMFQEDLTGIPALIAASFTDIDRSLIETIFDVTFGDEGGVADDTLASIEDSIMLGHDGDDMLSGWGEDTTFLGGLGDDTLSGGSGDDLYIYREGDGNDTIIESEYIWSDTDQLTFTDHQSTDVSFTRGANSELILVLNTGEQVTIQGHFGWDQENNVELIEFADGVIMNAQEIRDRTVAEQKATGAVVGSAQNENYYHTSGDGSYTITEYTPVYFWSSTDRLILTDQNSSDVALLNENGRDLVVTLSTLETITLIDFFWTSSSTFGMNRAVEFLEFADGEILDFQGIVDQSVIDTQNARDAAVANQLSAGNGIISGTELAENYVHAEGDGSYTITDYDDGNNSGTDTLTFTDLNSTEVTFNQIDYDLVATTAGGDVVTIEHYFYSNGRNVVETLSFADSVSLDWQGVRDRSVADQKAAGAVVVTGSELAENYVHAEGDGSYTINDFDPNSNSGTDTLTFTDLNSTNVSMIQSDYDLVITTDGGETITIDNYFDTDQDYHIEQISFADGVTMEWQAVRDRSVADQKAAGYAVVSGTSLGENYVHTSGDGSYTINDFDGGSNSGTDTLTFTDQSSTDVSITQVANDLVITASDGETVTIDNHFDADYDYTIDQIIFSEGVALTEFQVGTDGVDNTLTGDVGNNYLKGAGGSDTLTGGTGSDVLVGDLGADTFVFASGDGHDVVTDYEDGIDTIDLSATGLVFADITITTDGSGATEVDYGTGDLITLLGTAGQIEQSDFIFA